VERIRQTALVTGAARGIGLAIARRLAEGGFGVLLADKDLGAAEREAARLRSEGRDATAWQVDVADSRSVDAMVQAAIAHLGRIDVLVNNAGIAGRTAPIDETGDADWRAVLSTNLDGVFYCSRAVVGHMRRQAYGRIVNIASVAGKEGNPNAVAYSASKAGVIGLTKALAKEVATAGILVNCVTPAVVETDILKQASAEHVHYMVSRIPMGRMGRSEEVAALVAWLCSEECSFSTGAVFDISGGRATY
jgi:NAD(P)-dependent dehydrogenase (short-subunit alcohol dehydrogenase family)